MLGGFSPGVTGNAPRCPSNERGCHMYIGGGILTILLIILLIYLIA